VGGKTAYATYAGAAAGSAGSAGGEGTFAVPAGVHGGVAAAAYPPLPDGVFDTEYVMLNIGGIAARDGWLNVNSQPVRD
jgi:hypothetical protein